METAGFSSFSDKGGQGMKLLSCGLQRLSMEGVIIKLPGVFEADSSETERSRTEASAESYKGPNVETFFFQLLVSWAELGLLPLAIQPMQKNLKRAVMVSTYNPHSPRNVKLCSIEKDNWK